MKKFRIKEIERALGNARKRIIQDRNAFRDCSIDNSGTCPRAEDQEELDGLDSLITELDMAIQHCGLIGGRA